MSFMLGTSHRHTTDCVCVFSPLLWQDRSFNFTSHPGTCELGDNLFNVPGWSPSTAGICVAIDSVYFSTTLSGSDVSIAHTHTSSPLSSVFFLFFFCLSLPKSGANSLPIMYKTLLAPLLFVQRSTIGSNRHSVGEVRGTLAGQPGPDLMMSWDCIRLIFWWRPRLAPSYPPSVVVLLFHLSSWFLFDLLSSCCLQTGRAGKLTISTCPLGYDGNVVTSRSPGSIVVITVTCFWCCLTNWYLQKVDSSLLTFSDRFHARSQLEAFPRQQWFVLEQSLN